MSFPIGLKNKLIFLLEIRPIVRNLSKIFFIFRTHPSNLEILKKNVGKIDGYTNFQGYDEAR